MNFQESFTILNSDFPALKQNSKIEFKNWIYNGLISINLSKINTNRDLNLFRRKEITLRILFKKKNMKLTPLSLSQKISLCRNLRWKKSFKIKSRNLKKTDFNSLLSKRNKSRNLPMKSKGLWSHQNQGILKSKTGKLIRNRTCLHH